jgi:hypothetical protein
MCIERKDRVENSISSHHQNHNQDEAFSVSSSLTCDHPTSSKSSTRQSTPSPSVVSQLKETCGPIFLMFIVEKWWLRGSVRPIFFKDYVLHLLSYPRPTLWAYDGSYWSKSSDSVSCLLWIDKARVKDKTLVSCYLVFSRVTSQRPLFYTHKPFQTDPVSFSWETTCRSYVRVQNAFVEYEHESEQRMWVCEFLLEYEYESELTRVFYCVCTCISV